MKKGEGGKEGEFDYPRSKDLEHLIALRNYLLIIIFPMWHLT